MQKFEVRETGCWYCGKQGHVKRNCWSFKKAERQLKDEDINSVIEEFLPNLDSVESKIVQVKAKTKRHVHWWDGWKDGEKEVVVEEKELWRLREEEYMPSETQVESIVDSQNEEGANWSKVAGQRSWNYLWLQRTLQMA